MNLLQVIKRFFKGDRKFLTIVFFILFAILLIGIITPVIISNTSENWNNELESEIQSAQKYINSKLNEKENQLLKCNSELKQKLHSTLNNIDYAYGELISTITDTKYDKLIIKIIAPNGRVIAWNKMVVNRKNDIFPLNYPLGEIHFETSGLETRLALIDTIRIQNDIFYLQVEKPIEKLYSLQNRYYENLSFQNELSDNLNLDIQIKYDPFARPSKDGRIYSFPLLN